MTNRAGGPCGFVRPESKNEDEHNREQKYLYPQRYPKTDQEMRAQRDGWTKLMLRPSHSRVSTRRRVLCGRFWVSRAKLSCHLCVRRSGFATVPGLCMYTSAHIAQSITLVQLLFWLDLVSFTASPG